MEEREIIGLLAARIETPSRRALEGALEQLITEKVIPADTRLPTIRAVADAFSLSSSSVGMAWRALVQRQAIRTGTKGGSFVIGPPESLRPLRYLRNAAGVPSSVLDLGAPRADPALVPPVRRALLAAIAASHDGHGATQGEAVRITPNLESAARLTFPFPAASYLAAHRAIEGVGVALRALVRHGDSVAVEDPTTPRVIDNLDAMGARAVAVPWDHNGPDLRYLAYALRTANVFIYQPFTQTPTGRTVTPEWLALAAEVVRRRGATVIELVHNPFLADHGIPSLGAALPNQVIHIHGYSMSHGDDIRVSTIGASSPLIGQLTSSAAFTSQWVSPLLQNALANLLGDRASQRHVARARVEYLRRVAELTAHLHEAGFDVESADGLRVRVPVTDERVTQRHLQARGYHVHLGSSGTLRKDAIDHVVVNGAALIPDPRRFAAELAAIERELSPASGAAATNSLPRTESLAPRRRG